MLTTKFLLIIVFIKSCTAMNTTLPPPTTTTTSFRRIVGGWEVAEKNRSKKYKIWSIQRSVNLESNLWSPGFSQKTNEKIQLYYYDTSGWLVFWGKLKTPKRHFKINWPLTGFAIGVLCFATMQWPTVRHIIRTQDTKANLHSCVITTM